MRRTSAHGEIESVEVGDPAVASRLRLHQLTAQAVRQPIHHFILQLEQVRDILLEPIRPQMRAGLCVDQLRVDARSPLVAPATTTIPALAALKSDNRAAFEALRSQLKKAGCRVTAASRCASSIPIRMKRCSTPPGR